MQVKWYDKFEKDATSYSIFVVDGGDDFLKVYGGRYMISIFVGNSGRSYFLNDGYLHPSYLIEKFTNLGYADAVNISEYFEEHRVFEHE